MRRNHPHHQIKMGLFQTFGSRELIFPSPAHYEQILTFFSKKAKLVIFLDMRSALRKNYLTMMRAY